jgi:multiple antibiotic resistance protein
MWWQDHLSEFVTLLLVINPLEVLPSFLSVAGRFDRKAQRKLALQAVLAAFVFLVFFVIGGDFVLKHIGVSIRAFQIAGGIVLFLVALDMIHGVHHSGPDATDAEHRALAIYPLGFPKIAGPAALITVILLTDDDRFNVPGQLATIGVVALVLVLQLAILLAAVPITRWLGIAGAAVIGRIMGMLLAALAVSMVLTAVSEWLNLANL